MSVLIAVRLAKWIGVLLFSAGVLGGTLAGSLVDRQRAVYALATPGFVLTWLAGWTLLRFTGVSMGSTWVSASLLLSLGTFLASTWGVEGPGRPRRAVAVLTVLGLLGTLTLMSARPGTRTLAEASVGETP